MKKVIGLFSTLSSILLITGCYLDGTEIKFGDKPGKYQSKEEIIDYIDNYSECGNPGERKNCNLKGNYKIINENIDKSKEHESRVITFKLNDYDIEFTGESSCIGGQYSLGCSYEIGTNYIEVTSEFLIKKFIEENNIPDIEYSYYFEGNEKVINNRITMRISSKDDISKVAKYCRKYSNYIKTIENNSKVKFAFPDIISIEFEPLNKDKYAIYDLNEGITIDELDSAEQILNAYVKKHNMKF